jgi:hypothetical protein
MSLTQSQLDQICEDLDLYASWVTQADISALTEFSEAHKIFSSHGIGTSLVPCGTWGAAYDHESGQLDADYTAIKGLPQWEEVYEILYDLAEDYARFTAAKLVRIFFRGEDDTVDEMQSQGFRPLDGQDPQRSDCLWTVAA